jgi:hypothetical protein
LLYIPSIYLFQLALIQFMRVLCTSGNDAIAKYFYTFYLAEGKYKLWASAYRCHWLAVNTNVPAESWHNQLQQYFMLTPLRQQLKYEYEALETLRRSEQYYYTRWYQHCRGFSAKRGTKFQKEQEQRRLRGAGIRTAVMYLQADNLSLADSDKGQAVSWLVRSTSATATVATATATATATPTAAAPVTACGSDTIANTTIKLSTTRQSKKPSSRCSITIVAISRRRTPSCTMHW